MSFRFLSSISSDTPSRPRRALGPYYYDDFSWKPAPLCVEVHVFASGQLSRCRYALPRGRVSRKPKLRLGGFLCQEGIAVNVSPGTARRSSSIVMERGMGSCRRRLEVIVRESAGKQSSTCASHQVMAGEKRMTTTKAALMISSNSSPGIRRKGTPTTARRTTLYRRAWKLRVLAEYDWPPNRLLTACRPC